MVHKDSRVVTKAVAKPKKPRDPNNKRGGKREGAGRKVGGKNKQRLKQELTEHILREGGLMPLEFLLKVMRNPANSWAARITAARDAAPYVHPRLASVVMKGDKKEPLVTQLQMPNEVFRDLAQAVLSKMA